MIRVNKRNTTVQAILCDKFGYLITFTFLFTPLVEVLFYVVRIYVHVLNFDFNLVGNIIVDFGVISLYISLIEHRYN